MCPASLTASPERQIKNGMVVVVDPVLSFVSLIEVSDGVSSETWSWVARTPLFLSP